MVLKHQKRRKIGKRKSEVDFRDEFQTETHYLIWTRPNDFLNTIFRIHDSPDKSLQM